MERKLDDWITAYLQYAEDTEPPQSYHLWTAISLIAGALQRKVYLQWGHNKIYPNMYVIIVGPSGRTRKGDAMNLGMDIFSELNINTTAEAITRERLIRRMKEAITPYEIDGRTAYHCSMTTFSKELSVFLGQRDIKFLADLTDWYDSHDTWAYETKNSGKDHLQGICYNILAASAPDWLSSMLPLEAVGGGFTSRVIFIVEEKKGKTVSLPELTDEKGRLRKVLIHDLEKIHTMTGAFTFTDAAKKEYSRWYTLQDSLMAEGKFPIPDPRFAGYCDRRATHVKKLAMVMAASRSPDRVVEASDFVRARKTLEVAERKMPKVFGGLGRAATGEAVYTVLKHLMLVKEATMSDLLKKFYIDIDLTTMEQVCEILQRMKAVKMEINKEDTRLIYIGDGKK